MPYSPEDTAELARSVARVYAEAEQAVLRVIARELGRGLDSPQWAADKADAAGRVRRAAERLLAKALGDTQRLGDDAIVEAATMGAEAAIADTAALSDRAVAELRETALNPNVLNALAAAAMDWEAPPQRSVLRVVNDAYRQLTSQLAAATLSGVETRRNTAQRLLWKATERGITGFVDRSGRNWELASWAEMSLRSATARASLDAHTRTLGEAGHDLVTISDAPQECELCRPFEGKILSTSGDTSPGVHRLDSATGGPPVRVRVSGSLRDARDRGLFHPNCRHSASAYVPGASRRPRDTADPQGDADRQHLRYLERQVRKWKKREAASLNESAAKRARDKIRTYQADIREHVEQTTAKRQPQREQIRRAR